ncbi:hypothetical protein LCGC14_0940030 [marine sediment metagenome]|uniref:Glycosyltransferase 2-like domain-containing protein n=1 Tax=marine sediment metagenome TaxID=412755 RepID=A0A0F9NKB1_9ZZZZ
MHIIYRLCDAAGKNRPEWFSKEKCLRNFLEVFAAPAVYQSSGVHHYSHFILDGLCHEAYIDFERALVHCRVPHSWLSAIYINERHNARACRRAFDYALELKLPDDEILYFLEDDYLHLPGADRIIEEGIELGYDYVTCYDHPDKYMDPSPNPLVTHGGEGSRVWCGRQAHWKSTNSTTMTFAAKRGTIAEDWPVINEHLNGDYPYDFRMFRHLLDYRSRQLGSPIPGSATHVEQQWLAPRVNWQEVACGADG